ncbi:MAG TPA: hypothetical protein VG711_09670 [Phycisphaerales bacterium]|nr:hypothetical protein [Phycisphaerales bacterium]
MFPERPFNFRPACLHIRHKQMYVDTRHAQPGMVDDSSNTRIFWCNRSQDSLGPDGVPVNPTRCTNERSCFIQPTISAVKS